MSRYVFALVTALVLAAWVAAPALHAADAPADGTKLAYLSKVVVFNHSAHKAQDCKTCHHKWDGAAAIQKCTTAGCHDVFDKKDKTDKSLYAKIHGKSSSTMLGCVECHKKAAGDDKEKAKELAGCAKSKCHP